MEQNREPINKPHLWSMIKGTRIYNGEETVSSINGARKIGQLDVEEWNQNTLYNTIYKNNIYKNHIPKNNLVRVKKQQLELDMEQQTGSKSGKEYVKAVYCHPVYLIYMQSTWCKMPGWMKHKLDSRLPGELSITSDMQVIPPLWQKGKKN